MMIRQENVTNRDLELLCGALDHELNPEEQIEFDRRLTESTHLSNLFQTQKHLKTAVGQLPCRKVPHNFTLTREEARKAKRGSLLQPIFGWASVLSVLLVAVMFGSQLMFQTIPASVPGADSQIVTMKDAPNESALPEDSAGMSLRAAKPVYLLNWSYGAYGAYGMGGGGDGNGGLGGGGVQDTGGVSINIYVSEPVYQEDLPMEGSMMVPEEVLPEEFETEMPVEEALPAEEAPPEAMPGLEFAPTDEPVTATEQQRAHEAPKIYGIHPEAFGSVLKISPSVEQVEETVADQTLSSQEPGNEWQIPVSIGLLSAAIIFGLLWWYLKNKR